MGMHVLTYMHTICVVHKCIPEYIHISLRHTYKHASRDMIRVLTALPHVHALNVHTYMQTYIPSPRQFLFSVNAPSTKCWQERGTSHSQDKLVHRKVMASLLLELCQQHTPSLQTPHQFALRQTTNNLERLGMHSLLLHRVMTPKFKSISHHLAQNSRHHPFYQVLLARFFHVVTLQLLRVVGPPIETHCQEVACHLHGDALH